MEEEESCSEKSPQRRNKTETNDSLFITSSPGNTSSGYANTFRILENQIKRKLLRPTKLGSISEEEPSMLELELAARDRISELSCDKNVVNSEGAKSLNKQFKFDNVQNFIYHVSRSRNGALTLKPKHLTPTTDVSAADDYGKLTFLSAELEFYYFFVRTSGAKHSKTLRFPDFPMLSRSQAKSLDAADAIKALENGKSNVFDPLDTSMSFLPYIILQSRGRKETEKNLILAFIINRESSKRNKAYEKCSVVLCQTFGKNKKARENR